MKHGACKRLRGWLGLCLLITSLAAMADPLAAEWQAHQARFRYTGFTTHYTCDGFKSALKRLFRALGAKDDVRIEGVCVGNPNHPQLVQRVLIGFSVPVPATAQAVADDTFLAEWREVRLARGRGIEPGMCELVEQFRNQILPQFNARAINNNVHCTPGQRNLGQPDLTLTVLVQLPRAEIETADH